MCHMSRVACHVSCVTCQVSGVTCHVSHVMSQVSHVFFFVQNGGVSKGRVCYQRGLPRLFSADPAKVRGYHTNIVAIKSFNANLQISHFLPVQPLIEEIWIYSLLGYRFSIFGFLTQ